MRLGGGPVIYRGPNMNPRVVNRLVEVAEKGAVPYQMAASGRTTGPTPTQCKSPRRHGHGTGQHPKPLHAQPGRNDFAHGYRPHGQPASRLRLSLKSTDDFTP